MLRLQVSARLHLRLEVSNLPSYLALLIHFGSVQQILKRLSSLFLPILIQRISLNVMAQS